MKESTEPEPEREISKEQTIALERYQKHLETCPNCHGPRDLCAEGYWLRNLSQLW